MERGKITKYVPDASVAVKWFIEEEGSESAQNLKERFVNGTVDLEAPSLLSYEVASAIRFHPIVKLTPKQFQTVMRALEGMQIIREPTHTEWISAHTLSLENQISIYDSIYVGFALHGNSIMVTADTALVRKVRATQTTDMILLLEDLGVQ